MGDRGTTGARRDTVAYPIDYRLPIAVSSSELFDLTESDTVWATEGLRMYEREAIGVGSSKLAQRFRNAISESHDGEEPHVRSSCLWIHSISCRTPRRLDGVGEERLPLRGVGHHDR